MSVDVHLKQFEISSQALLRLLCWFSPEPVPLSVFQTRQANLIFHAAVNRLAQACRLAPADQPTLQTALALLTDAAILQMIPQAAVYLVDRNARIGTRTQIQPDQQRFWLRCAMTMIQASIPDDPWAISSKPVMDALVPHIDAMIAAGERFGIHHPTAKLIIDVGWHSFGQGKYGQTESFFRRAVAMDRQKFGLDSCWAARNIPIVARALSFTTGDRAAESMLRTSMASLEKNAGHNDAWLCEHLAELADVLYRTKRLAEAELTSRRSLTILEHEYGPDHPSVASGLNALAFILQMTDPDHAVRLLRRALNIDEQNFGPSHPQVAADIHALACAGGPAQRLADIEPLLLQAREITFQFYGPDHPASGESLYWDAVRLGEEQEFEEAEDVLRKAMSIHEKCAGEDRWMFFRDLNLLAVLYKLSKKYDEAKALFLRLLSKYEQWPGLASLRLAGCLNNGAQLYKVMQRYAEAEPLFGQSLDIYLQFGADTGRRHRQLPFSVNNYRQLLTEMGCSQDGIKARIQTLLQPFGISADDLPIPVGHRAQVAE